MEFRFNILVHKILLDNVTSGRRSTFVCNLRNFSNIFTLNNAESPRETKRQREEEKERKRVRERERKIERERRLS